MRLLQITGSDVWRGHEQQIVYYYESFNTKIEHQTLICPSGTKLAEIALNNHYNVHAIPLKSKYSYTWVKKINEVIKNEKIDLILIHNSTAHTLCVIASILANKKIPMVFFRTLIKDISKSRITKWKYNYQHLVKIICVSQAVIDALKPSIKDHSRFSIVGSATNLDDFKKQARTNKLHDELGLPYQTKLIANISAFVPFKDHFTFVKTVKILKSQLPNTKFLLIGTGKLEDTIKELVRKLDLDNDILFLGFRNDIPEIFPEFDLFLFTSKLEPTGGVLLEAYACRVPIIATNFGGIPEVVIHNETGLLCEKENPEAFAEAVIKVLGNKNLSNTFIENGYNRLKENFTKEVITEKMYNELIKVYHSTN